MNIQEYVKKVVDQAPPLTFDQANRIAALLNPGGLKIARHHPKQHNKKSDVKRNTS